jgi:hypothetical protein
MGNVMLVLYDCPKCAAPLTVRVPPQTWEHGVHFEKRMDCHGPACGERMTVAVRVTREEKAGG